MNVLTYRAARQFMRSGDLLCTDCPGLIEWGIRAVTHGPVSHTAGVIEVSIGGTRRLFVAEATAARGVQLVALSTWMQQRKRGAIYWWPSGMTGRERDVYADTIQAEVGKRYESRWLMLARVAFHRPAENDRWYCSEIDAKGRRAAQPDTFRNLWPRGKAVWPADSARAYGGIAAATQVCP